MGMLLCRFGVFLAIAQPCVPHKGPPGWALGSSSERESRGLDLKVPFEPFKSLTCAGVCVFGGSALNTSQLETWPSLAS